MFDAISVGHICIDLTPDIPARATAAFRISL